ncbi:MAG: hypothetical protein V7K32_16050 [Nostoc sp.]|uniref:hypothetical protein n=1 Tax=Nostoc sp. TaxID=1180 RepID=UPI002FF5F358
MNHIVIKQDVSSLFEQAIANALNSVNPQKVLEGKVANAIIQARFDLVSFNKTVGLNGEVGKIDVETSNAIIEVTTQTARKLKPVQKLISNSDLNPFNKPVILYAPNYKFTPSQDIIATGSYIVYSQD